MIRRLTMKQLLSGLLGATLALAGIAPAHAQEYPDKPIRIIVGPGPDALARLVGQRFTEAWGQQIIVDQRPAAGGIVAADAVAKAPPDGYTLLLSTGSFTINSALNAKLPYDFLRDLAPVSLMATIPFILSVRPDAPYQSLKDLVEAARAQPGKLNYASAGNGTPPHLAGEMLKQMAKIDMVHVPYKGVAPAITDLIGGQVQAMFAVAPSGLPQVRGGKLSALAVSSPKRYSQLPDVPTVAEQGYPEFQVVGWNGLHAPAKTPTAIIAKLNQEIARVLKSKDGQEKALAAGFEPVGSTVEEFDAFQKADIARSARVIKAANIKVD
jgi:tripartite-type tricarboxylate transporter receptor subunit TctC